MGAPKPITLEPIEAPERPDPQPFALVAEGYDPAATQTLTHVNGVLTWVTAP